MSHEPIIVAVFIGGDETWYEFHQGDVGKDYRIERVTNDDPRIAESDFDVALADIKHLNPTELSELVRRLEAEEIPVLAIAESTDSNGATEALNAGAYDVINVPATVEMLRARLRTLARLHRRDHRAARRTAERFKLLQETLPLIMYEGRLANGGGIRLEDFELWTERETTLSASIERFEEWRSMIHPEDRLGHEDALRAVRSGEVGSWSVEYRWSPASSDEGEVAWRWMFERGARIMPDSDDVIGFVLDVSDRKSLELQLTRAQKMEAIGRLAGGVAHDFNNLLTAIINFTWYVRDELPAESSLRDDLGEVLKAAESGAYLTSQLLAFSRRQPVEPMVVELNDRLRTIEEVLRRTLGSDVEVVVEPASESLRVTIDPGQFDQLLFNLAVNSRDAMPGGGALYVRLRREGDHAVMEVADTGVGIPDEIIDQVFDPFFSTKGESGTGLGLATCYGIVRQAGGDITARSEPGEGTNFTVRLPLEITQSFGGTEQYDVIPSVEKDALALVIEDQPAILTMVTRVLQRVGYAVEAAATGEDALAKAEELEQRPAIMISDVMLPGLTGPQLMKRLRKRWPTLPVLLMSGYLSDDNELEIEQEPAAAFLSKPFTPAQFLAAVARLTGSSTEEE